MSFIEQTVRLFVAAPILFLLAGCSTISLYKTMAAVSMEVEPQHPKISFTPPDKTLVKVYASGPTGPGGRSRGTLDIDEREILFFAEKSGFNSCEFGWFGFSDPSDTCKDPEPNNRTIVGLSMDRSKTNWPDEHIHIKKSSITLIDNVTGNKYKPITIRASYVHDNGYHFSKEWIGEELIICRSLANGDQPVKSKEQTCTHSFELEFDRKWEYGKSYTLEIRPFKFLKFSIERLAIQFSTYPVVSHVSYSIM